MITLPPFKSFLASNIPSIYDNTLSYYDELTKLIAYLEQVVVPAVNETAGQVDGIKKGLEDLKSYVDHYFDNLDVQEEINNKLDEMAEGGQLAAIIAQFLELSPVFAYDTILYMSNADNLNNGCIARVLGNTAAADGDGAYYKVRTKEPGESADGVQKVAIGDSLIADRITDATANNLQAQIDELRMPPKKYLFVGDSYATGYQGEGNPTLTGFFTRVKNTLNLTATIVAANGYGFLGIENILKWQNLIENTSIADKDTYTDIIIAGGMNDDTTNLGYQIDTTIAYLKTNFPNATIHIAMVGKYKAATASELARIRSVYQIYKDGAGRNKCKFVENAQYILHNISFFNNDNIHPTESGQSALAKYFIEYISNGSMSVFYPNTISSITNGSNISENFTLYTTLENNIVRALISGRVTFSNPIATLSNLDSITLGTLTSSYLTASENYQGLNIQCQGYAWSNQDNKPHSITICISNNQSNVLTARILLLGEDNVYTISQVNEINIIGGEISDTIPSIYC